MPQFWSSVCGVHKGNYIISGKCSLPSHSVQLCLPASLMLGGNQCQVPCHTLMQVLHWHSKVKVMASVSNSSSRNVKRRHRLQP